MFVIQSKEENMFWNNQFGWVDVSSATQFTPKEKESVNLPIDGKWIHIYEFTENQIMEILAEYMVNTGAINPENEWVESINVNGVFVEIGKNE